MANNDTNNDTIRADFYCETKIQKATDQDSTRYSLQHVSVCQAQEDTRQTDENGTTTGHAPTVWLTASDGRIIAVTECDGTTDQPRLMPVEVAPTVKKGARIILNGQWENDRNKTADPVKPHRFAPCSQTVPEKLSSMYHAVTLDPEYIRAVADACHRADDDDSRGITFFIPKGKGAGSRPTICNTNRGFALIMPMSANHDRREADLNAKLSRYHRQWAQPE